MKLNLTSMAFGYKVLDSGATPNWATSLGQSVTYKIEERSGAFPLLPGLVYCSIPLSSVKVRKGKGGSTFVGSNPDSGVVLASLFKKTFVNRMLIPDGKFLLYIDRDDSKSHSGRLRLKYSRYAVFSDGGSEFSNEQFLEKTKTVLGLGENACWFVYDISIENQDELYLSAVVVDADEGKEYETAAALNSEWSALIPVDVTWTLPTLSDLLCFFASDVTAAGLKYEDKFLKRFVAALLAKPFVILTGLSGSGKTKLAEAFASWLGTRFVEDDGTGGSRHLLVPVGADWTNNEHLLGYPDALHENTYVLPDSKVLQFILAAKANPGDPYFLILDEMNLSHVERYFADFLSAMESSERTLHLHGVAAGLKAGIPKTSIGSDETPEADDDNPDVQIIPADLELPDNLFVIGTMNVDETTYMVSPKVLDRAQTLEFRVSHEGIDGFLSGSPDVRMDKLKDGGGKPLGESFATPFLMFAKTHGTNLPSPMAKVLKSNLLAAFDELSKLGAEFAFRSTAEIVSFAAFARKARLSVREIIDAAILQKLLPRVHGSRRKLEKPLEALWGVCRKPGDMTELLATREEFAADFYAAHCRFPWSGEKIARMYRQAIDNGFASFAEA